MTLTIDQSRQISGVSKTNIAVIDAEIRFPSHQINPLSFASHSGIVTVTKFFCPSFSTSH